MANEFKVGDLVMYSRGFKREWVEKMHPYALSPCRAIAVQLFSVTLAKFPGDLVGHSWANEYIKRVSRKPTIIL